MKKRFKNTDVEEEVETVTMTGTNPQAVLLPVKLWQWRLSDFVSRLCGNTECCAQLLLLMLLKMCEVRRHHVPCGSWYSRLQNNKSKETRTNADTEGRSGTSVDAWMNVEWSWTPVLTDDWSRYVVNVNKRLVNGQLPVAPLLVFQLHSRDTTFPHAPAKCYTLPEQTCMLTEPC